MLVYRYMFAMSIVAKIFKRRYYKEIRSKANLRWRRWYASKGPLEKKEFCVRKGLQNKSRMSKQVLMEYKRVLKLGLNLKS